jgi:hypothetical protein
MYYNILRGDKGLILLGDSSVSSHDEYGRHITFQSTIQKWETFNIQHMYLVNEQYLDKNIKS